MPLVIYQNILVFISYVKSYCHNNKPNIPVLLYICMIPGNHIQNFEESKKHLKIAEHMIIISSTILGESTLFPKILEELHKSADFLIKSLLQYEYYQKNIPIYRDQKLNMKTFREKISPKYFQYEEHNLLMQTLLSGSMKKNSPVEFVKKDKLILMSDGNYRTIEKEVIMNFAKNLRKILKNPKIRLGLSK